MTEEKKKLPGVRLEHRGSKIYERGGQKNAEMTVVAKIHDEEIWKDVEQKFIAGFDVFTSDDFKSEIIAAMRNELFELSAKLRIMEGERDRARREVVILEAKVEEAQRPMRELGRRLSGGQ